MVHRSIFHDPKTQLAQASEKRDYCSKNLRVPQAEPRLEPMDALVPDPLQNCAESANRLLRVLCSVATKHRKLSVGGFSFGSFIAIRRMVSSGGFTSRSRSTAGSAKKLLSSGISIRPTRFLARSNSSSPGIMLASLRNADHSTSLARMAGAGRVRSN